MNIQKSNLAGALLLTLCAATPCPAVPDLWIRDDAVDPGAEPNTLSPYLYVSDDIWVRTSADPNYDPTPYPTASPVWTPQPHQNPCYRDPRTSSPNYMYIRVRNRGTTASLGTETLHAYWAKASTGLNWSSDWKDHIASPCGTPRLYGQEITKPRKNGATATVAEKNAFVAATQAIDTASFMLGGATCFDKQNLIHLEVTSVGNGGTGLQLAHSNIRFFSWHREMISRYEVLLQEADPTVNLFYWDWNLSAVGTISGAGGYMGASTGSVGAPFTGWGITRNWGGAIPVAMNAATQATILTNTAFATFRSNLEVQPHNSSHNHTGGTTQAPPTGARDPIFFHIHTNVDRLWAKWQRAQLSRWRPSTAYDVSQANVNLTADLEPWAGGASMSPWLNQIPGDPDGYQIFKKSTARSVIYPPVYDDVPLTIPVLAAGQSCIIEIPFFPPRRNECGTFVDPAHLCLLARIETSPTAPFGMTAFPEGSTLWLNVKNNNNIAWKNTTLDDCNVGPFMAFLVPGGAGIAGEIVRPIQRNPNRPLTLRFFETRGGQLTVGQVGQVLVRFNDTLMEAWVRGGAIATGAQMRADGYFAIDGAEGATFDKIMLPDGKFGTYDLFLDPMADYQHPRGQVFTYDVVQMEDMGNGLTPVGGQRYLLDINKLVISPKESEWQVVDGGQVPAQWPPLDLPANSRKGKAPFATYALEGETRIALKDEANAAYFVRAFDIHHVQQARNVQLELRADDGVAVYLNGNLIHQDNLPASTPAGGGWNVGTPALSPRRNLQARGFRTILLPEAQQYLKTGRNILAVEVHRVPREDISMDLELAVNGSPDVKPPPQAEVLTSLENDRTVVQFGEIIAVTVDAIAEQGYTAMITYDDGILYTGPVNLPVGTHRFTALVTNPGGASTRAIKLIQVVPNLPPLIRIEVGVHPGGLHVDTYASDPPNGTVQRVDFYLKSHSSFASPSVLVGSAFAPPFGFQLPAIPAPGEYMFYAIAVDNQGLATDSAATHIVIPKPDAALLTALSLRPEPGIPAADAFTLDWDLPGSHLEEWTPDLGWITLRGAVPPFIVDKAASRRLLRVVNPDGVSIHNH